MTITLITVTMMTMVFFGTNLNLKTRHGQAVINGTLVLGKFTTLTEGDFLPVLSTDTSSSNGAKMLQYVYSTSLVPVPVPVPVFGRIMLQYLYSISLVPVLEMNTNSISLIPSTSVSVCMTLTEGEFLPVPVLSTESQYK